MLCRRSLNYTSQRLVLNWRASSAIHSSAVHLSADSYAATVQSYCRDVPEGMENSRLKNSEVTRNDGGTSSLKIFEATANHGESNIQPVDSPIVGGDTSSMIYDSSEKSLVLATGTEIATRSLGNDAMSNIISNCTEPKDNEDSSLNSNTSFNYDVTSETHQENLLPNEKQSHFYGYQLDEFLKSKRLIPLSRNYGKPRSTMNALEYEFTFRDILQLLGRLSVDKKILKQKFSLNVEKINIPDKECRSNRTQNVDFPAEPKVWTSKSLITYIKELIKRVNFNPEKYGTLHVTTILLDLLRINNTKTIKSQSTAAYNIVMCYFIKNKNLRASRLLFQWICEGSLLNPDITTFNLLFHGSSIIENKHQRLGYIKSLLEDMVHENIHANRQTWNLIFVALDKSEFQGVLLQEMCRYGITMSPRTGIYFIKYMIKNFGLNVAMGLCNLPNLPFKFGISHDNIFLKELLDGKTAPDINLAWKYLLFRKNSRNYKFQPTAATLNILLKACAFSGRLDWCIGVIGKFLLQWNVPLNKISYSLLLKAIKKAPYDPVKFQTASWIYRFGKYYGGNWNDKTFNSWELRHFVKGLQKEARMHGNGHLVDFTSELDPRDLSKWYNLLSIFQWDKTPLLKYDRSKEIYSISNMRVKDLSSTSTLNTGSLKRYRKKKILKHTVDQNQVKVSRNQGLKIIVRKEERLQREIVEYGLMETLRKHWP